MWVELGQANMAAKGIATVAIGASAGALATVAGYYMANKIKELFGRKPKMKLFNNELLLSTRCTWFISGKQSYVLTYFCTTVNSKADNTGYKLQFSPGGANANDSPALLIGPTETLTKETNDGGGGRPHASKVMG